MNNVLHIIYTFTVLGRGSRIIIIRERGTKAYQYTHYRGDAVIAAMGGYTRRYTSTSLMVWTKNIV